MSEAVFPIHVAAALDRLAVPALPMGFGDRLAARIASGDLPDEAGFMDIALPVLRRSVAPTGWRRAGRIAFVAASFGLATATAAAAGVFGEPVYIPVVSQALAKAQIVEMPVTKPAEKKSVKAEQVLTTEPKKDAKAAPSGKDAVLALIAELRADPAYRSLLREQRQERAKTEIAKLLAEGKAQKADVKAAWIELAAERKAANQAKAVQDQPERAQRMTDAKRRAIASGAKPLTPEQKEKVRDAINQLTDAQRGELQALRQRRRDAAPQERPAINREIRAFWQRSGVKPGADSTNSETL